MTLLAVAFPTPSMLVSSFIVSVVMSRPSDSRLSPAFSYARTLNDCGLPSSRPVSVTNSPSMAKTSREVVMGRC